MGGISTSVFKLFFAEISTNGASLGLIVTELPTPLVTLTRDEPVVREEGRGLFCTVVCPAGRLVLRVMSALLLLVLTDTGVLWVALEGLSGWRELCRLPLVAVETPVEAVVFRLEILTRYSSNLTVSRWSPAISESLMLKAWSPPTWRGSG